MSKPYIPKLVLADLTDADAEILAGWLRRQSSTAILLSGGRERVTAERLLRSQDGSGDSFLMVKTVDQRRPVGFVTYQGRGARVFEAGVGIGESSEWGSGYGGEAIALLFDLLFHRMGAHRVQVSVAGYNWHSLAMIKRSGLEIDGVLRENVFLDGEWHDTVIASMLDREYYASPIYSPEIDVIPAEMKAKARALVEQIRPRPRRT
ncbi:RimJ/RimL family protein N-acetyltransferase [Micrococcus sp. 140720015-1]